MINTKNRQKAELLKEIEHFLADNDLEIVDSNLDKPWGAYFVINENQAEHFIGKFFPHLSLSDFGGFAKLSPKILVVAPEMRLSWQYHHRRAEIWKLIMGTAGLAVSDTDVENLPKALQIGQVVNLKCGQRHRLIGLEGQFGIVAEIWQHTDKDLPSNEDDIVRVQDDFGR